MLSFNHTPKYFLDIFVFLKLPLTFHAEKTDCRVLTISQINKKFTIIIDFMNDCHSLNKKYITANQKDLTSYSDTDTKAKRMECSLYFLSVPEYASKIFAFNK